LFVGFHFTACSSVGIFCCVHATRVSVTPAVDRPAHREGRRSLDDLPNTPDSPDAPDAPNSPEIIRPANPEPLVLTYVRNGRRPLPRKVIHGLILVVLGIALLLVSPRLLRWGRARYLYQQCVSNPIPKDAVVYEEDVPAAAKLLQNSEQYRDLGSGWAARLPPPCRNSLRSVLQDEAAASNIVLFMQELRSADGRAFGLVEIRFDGMGYTAPDNKLTLYGQLPIRCRQNEEPPPYDTIKLSSSYIDGGSWWNTPVAKNHSTFRFSAESPGSELAEPIRLYAGRPVAGDPSSCTIPFRSKNAHGQIICTLQGDGRVTFQFVVD
jgi:hypothetical protein